MRTRDEPQRPKQSFLHSFRVAWDGLTDAMRLDRNLRIHALLTVVVIVAGWWCGLSRIEWSVLVLTIGLVWTAELINTAIEAVVDLASPEHHELARIAKDVASAAVLVASVASVIVGVLVFGPRLLSGLSEPSRVTLIGKPFHHGRTGVEFGLRQHGRGFRDQFVSRLMKPCREQPELGMLHMKAAWSFGNASFAKQQRLPAGRESFTDDSPFHQRVLALLLHDMPMSPKLSDFGESRHRARVWRRRLRGSRLNDGSRVRRSRRRVLRR